MSKLHQVLLMFLNLYVRQHLFELVKNVGDQIRRTNLFTHVSNHLRFGLCPFHHVTCSCSEYVSHNISVNTASKVNEVFHLITAPGFPRN